MPSRLRRLLGLMIVLASGLALVPLSAARTEPPTGATTVPTLHRVTLLTGDTVHVATHRDGKRSISLEPGPDGTMPEAAITEVGEHAYVVPKAALPLLAAHRLDLELFDVTALIDQRYDDAHRATLPVIVDYGAGADAAAESRAARLQHARKTVTLASLGAAAFAAEKRHARAFWRALTAPPNAAGSTTALAGGATRVDLDGQVRATLDTSVAQIHAPAAWAAGFDGTGSTVAVLDTGYDNSHPDLASAVSESSNFTTDPSVVDGNGHGTHVASTIAGTGAGSGGIYRGVAPGAKLMVGKVLADAGFGEDSWVLAGMQWAVARGADVVNMSLGGDVGDGTDPLSRAIDELSASSDTLFVVAAGNGGSGPMTVTAPGAADAALTVGAVDDADLMAYFSSRGPRSGDGALKPDVVAPGVGITAARAAGTSLGFPVDDLHTSLEGTSMATPHVAGLAAILKDAHPQWDGERLKAAITSTTVPVADATGFDAGSGRVDAARAVAATVLGSPSLNLGYYAWPQTDLPTTRTPLTYTNIGGAPATLALSLASQDGVAAAPTGVSLSASTLTIPAGGEASIDVLLDPSLPGTGSFSGVVIASDLTGTVARTSFGFGLESEHHNLTVQLKPRSGTQHATHVIGLAGIDVGFFDQRVVTGNGAQSITWRVPPGTYSAGGISFQLAADGAEEGVLTYDPDVAVHSTKTITLDGDAARRFGHSIEQPVSTDGQFMSVYWNTNTGGTGFTFAGNADRLYAKPMQSSAAGTVDSYLHWMLSQPDAELVGTGSPVPLRSLGGSPALESRAFPIVDAGSVGALRTTSARNAIALVAGDCGDLGPAAAALSAAGAVAVVAYAGAGADCAGTIGEAALPVFEARPFEVLGLLKRNRPARIITHESPHYIYDLAGAWNGFVPDGAVLEGATQRLGAIVERYDSLGPAAGEGHQLWTMPLGWVPGGYAAFGLVRPVAVPSTVTHYVSPIAEWERTVDVRDASGVTEGFLSSPRRVFAAGTTTRDQWFGGPIATRVAPPTAQWDWQASPYRQEDFIRAVMPPFVDQAGHEGGVLYLDEFYGQLFRDGELIAEGDDSLRLQTSVPAERHDYRLVYSNFRRNAFWQRSSRATTEWEFSSQRPEGDHEVLPLLSIDYDLALSGTNTAPGGKPLSFDLGFRMPPEVVVKPLARVSVEVSWDGGMSWTALDARGCLLKKSCTVKLKNQRSGSASLRVSAADTAGRAVTQTVIDAYAVD